MRKIILDREEIKLLNQLEDENAHTERLVWLANKTENKHLIAIMEAISIIHKAENCIPHPIYLYRETISKQIQEHFLNIDV